MPNTVKECTCSSSTVTKYQKRISGPLLDRIDIHIEVPRVQYEKLSDGRLGESSADIRARVEAARERQRARFNGKEGEKPTDILSNADMRPAEVRKFCKLDVALCTNRCWFFGQALHLYAPISIKAHPSNSGSYPHIRR